MKRILCVLTLAIAFVAISMPSLWAASSSTITLAAADTQSTGQTQGGKPDDKNISECPRPTKPPTSGKTPEPLTVLLLAAGGAGVLALRKRLKK